MPSSQLVFGPFRLDPANACLWHGAEAGPAPKAFDVLHYLVTHPDRLVTKDELLDAVWPETAVTDAVVRNAIGVLRKVLRRYGADTPYIATVPRRGYRFLAPSRSTPRRRLAPLSQCRPQYSRHQRCGRLVRRRRRWTRWQCTPIRAWHRSQAPCRRLRPNAATFVVVVGDVGEEARQEPLALGETPNIAARLQHLAAPNTLVISAATYHLIEGYFTCEA